MTEQDDEAERKRQAEIEKARAESAGEDVVFPESFRKLWRTLLGPWNRR